MFIFNFLPFKNIETTVLHFPDARKSLPFSQGVGAEQMKLKFESLWYQTCHCNKRVVKKYIFYCAKSKATYNKNEVSEFSFVYTSLQIQLRSHPVDWIIEKGFHLLNGLSSPTVVV